MSVSPRRPDRVSSPPHSADAAEEVASSSASDAVPKTAAPKLCAHCGAKLTPHSDGERFHCDAPPGCGCCFLKDGSMSPGHAMCKQAADAEAAKAS